MEATAATRSNGKPVITVRERYLISRLKEVLKHVAVRDAMGQPSTLFCRGCEKDRRRPCPVPDITRYLAKFESGEVEE